MKKSWKRVLLVALVVCAVLSGLVSCKKQEAKGEYKATVSIDCSKIWAHEADLNADKADYVPKDGVVLGETEVFFDGEVTAYDLLQAVCQERKIQMDAEDSAYGKYVKGIAQLYAGDCGDMSGWMYKVNGEFAEVGCDAYTVQEGDEICWVFICDYLTDC